MAIKVYLDEQLRARGITAKELCARVGITEANLSILRSGKAKGVRFHTINRICYYLQCDVGDILKFDGELDTPHGRASPIFPSIFFPVIVPLPVCTRTGAAPTGRRVRSGGIFSPM